MDNMILGRYIPGNSIVHRLDPRSKLVAMILLIIIVFWANNPITNVILFVVFISGSQTRQNPSHMLGNGLLRCRRTLCSAMRLSAEWGIWS